MEKKRLIAAACCLACAYLLTPNRYFMSVEKESLAQYQFRDVIRSQSSEATLLNYGFLDGGFYTVCEVTPNCKAFCGLNIAIDELTELQDYYVENGLCEYVITKSELPRQFAKYDCIAKCESDYSYSQSVYYLYRLK